MIVVIATDAPLSSRQLERLAVACGARPCPNRIDVWQYERRHFHRLFDGEHGSAIDASRTLSATFISPESTATLNPLFQAVVEATEESVLNALTKADTMTGINGNRVHALPYDRLKAAMAKYGRK